MQKTLKHFKLRVMNYLNCGSSNKPSLHKMDVKWMNFEFDYKNNRSISPCTVFSSANFYVDSRWMLNDMVLFYLIKSFPLGFLIVNQYWSFLGWIDQSGALIKTTFFICRIFHRYIPTSSANYKRYYMTILQNQFSIQSWEI